MHSETTVDFIEELESKNIDLDRIRRYAEDLERKLILNDDGDLEKNLGHCSLILGNDKKAHEYYQKALLIKGVDDNELWYGIGLMYYRNNNFTYAEPSFLRVVMADPDFPKRFSIYLKLGLIFKRFSHWLDAVTYFQKCLVSDLKIPAQFQFCYCYYQTGKYDEALNCYKEAHNLSKSPYTALCLGWHISFYDSTTGLRYLYEGLALCKKDTVEELDLLYAIARVLYNKKDYNEASNCYYKLLNKNSGDFNLWNSFGIMCAEIDQSSQAFRCFIKASEILPDSVEVWNNIGTLYWKSGQINESRLAYEKAKKINLNSDLIKEETKEYVYSEWNISELPYMKRNPITKMKFDIKEPDVPKIPSGFVNTGLINQNIINSYAAMIGYYNYARQYASMRQFKTIGNEDDKQAAEILTDLSQVLPNKRSRDSV
ncbi:hypothetical protein SteCoe_9570 [Stentor coeruleus]|uniref:Uncharacterized protein n=1 Tax=Stentor coeruleus TaxID=5963 RepID=A0A1R2CHP0_9CILI|nr:hypothetical protein SteCoe_9570 [Stentor coeruleus]